MASPTDYQNLLQVIQKLDKRRRQVFVQAMIAEVSIDKAKDLGVQWGLFGGASDGKDAGVCGQYDPHSVLSDVIGSTATAPRQALAASNLAGTRPILRSVLKALQSNGAVNVLSTPNIMTSDNKEAEIFVGENVPLITSQAQCTSAAHAVDRTKDTGITLKITPQISEGEYVKLDIDQEISAVKMREQGAGHRHRHHQALGQDVGSREKQGHRGDRRTDPGSGPGNDQQNSVAR